MRMALSATLKVDQWWRAPVPVDEIDDAAEAQPVDEVADRAARDEGERDGQQAALAPPARRKTPMTARAIAVAPRKKARRPNEGARRASPNTPPVFRPKVRSKKPGMTVSGGAPAQVLEHPGLRRLVDGEHDRDDDQGRPQETPSSALHRCLMSCRPVLGR